METNKLREVVERVVADTLNAHVAALTSEIVDRASRELEPLVSEQVAPVAAEETSSDGSMPAGSAATHRGEARFPVSQCRPQAAACFP